MSSEGISNIKGLQEMLHFMEHETMEATLEDMKEDSKEIYKRVRSVHAEFFRELSNFVESVVDDEDAPPPGSIKPYLSGMAWKKLSSEWVRQKRVASAEAHFGFYHGITRFRRRRNKPFSDYLFDHIGNEKLVDKLVGPPSMTFDVSKAGKNFTLSRNGAEITYVKTDLVKNGKFQSRSKKEYTIGVTILNFPKLVPHATGTWSEWTFVDRMIKEVGRSSSHAKQLVKINSSRGFGAKRPIRPLIIPVVIKQLEKVNKKLERIF